MNKEETAKEWIRIAEKYIPDLKDDQRRLIISMAYCKKFDQELLKKAAFDSERIECNCGLCMRTAIINLLNHS